MPLHGQGIDVYEFVEKGAKIDEPLASYIFRQVTSLDQLDENCTNDRLSLACRCCFLPPSESSGSSRYQRRESHHQRTISHQTDRLR